MLVLGLDTSTHIGSVGLMEDDKPLAEITLNVEVTHSERLLESIDYVLKNSARRIEDLDLISYSKGPGSFTGLRIGLATVKGIAFSLGKKIIGVSSLEALAINLAYTPYQICPMIDARKEEVYTALYEFRGKTLKVKAKERVINPLDAVRGIKGKTVFIGTGARRYADIIKKRLKNAEIGESKYDIARGINVAVLGAKAFKKGKSDDVDSVLPTYLRKSQAEVNLKG